MSKAEQFLNKELENAVSASKNLGGPGTNHSMNICANMPKRAGSMQTEFLSEVSLSISPKFSVEVDAGCNDSLADLAMLKTASQAACI